MADIDLRCGDSYNSLDPELYLESYADTSAQYHLLRNFPLQHFHEFYLGCQPNLKILDYGTGPVIAYLISAAQYAPEIVLAEYSDSFRSALQKWVDCDATAHNWTAYFKYVVEDLEGKREKEAKEREILLRNAIKAIVPCDISQDIPIPAEYNVLEYDVVSSTLCLEAACSSSNEYKDAILKLYRLVKPGGRLALYTAQEKVGPDPVYYCIGKDKFRSLQLSKKFIRETLEETGFSQIEMSTAFAEELNIPSSEVVSFTFFSACKNH